MEGEWDEIVELQRQDLVDRRAFAGTMLYVLYAPLHPLGICTTLNFHLGTCTALNFHTLENSLV